MKIIKLTKRDNTYLQETVKVLRSGGTVVYPTPTCYGLGAAISKKNGIKKIYRIKGRQAHAPLNVAVDNVNLFKKYGEYCSLISMIRKKYPEESFTFIVKRKRSVPKFLNPTFKKIGIILTKSGIHKNIVDHLGEPIVGTSANKSGWENCYTVQSVCAQFEKNKVKPDLILDYGELPMRKPSTIVEIFDEKTFKVLRRGNIKNIIV